MTKNRKEINGYVGVLINKKRGSGYSTTNPDFPEAVFDPNVIQLVEKDGTQEDFEKYIESTYGELVFHCCDLEGLEVVWVPRGTKFIIVDESDVGIETLYTALDFLEA